MMRRKSERNKGKSPEPAPKSEKPKRGRPSRKRRKSSSSERESGSDDGSQENPEVVQIVEVAPLEDKPVEVNCDDDSEPVWQVKKSENPVDSGEIQKLKICLARPPSTPERPDRSPRGKKRSSHSSVETLSDTSDDKRKSRLKSRRNSVKEASAGEDFSESEENIGKLDEPKTQEEAKNIPQVECDTSQQDNTPTASVDEVKEAEQNDNQVISTLEEIPITTPDEVTPVKDDGNTEKIVTEHEENVGKEESTPDKETVNEDNKHEDQEVNEDVKAKLSNESEKKGVEENENKIPQHNDSNEDIGDKVESVEDIIQPTAKQQNIVESDSNNDSFKASNSDIIEDITGGMKHESTTESSSVRKRRWGSRTSKVNKTSIVSISTDSLKNLIPKVEPLSVEDVLLEVKPKEEVQVEKVILEEKIKPNGKYNNTINKPKERDILGSMTHRKISVVNEDIPKEQRSPSPPRHKSSSVLYISNLVRPFTLPQLKNLLLRTGKIVENGFWIDKIKSRCYVQYQTEDEAIETRHALHGVTWPVSNPKTLVVDFSSESAMRDAMESNEDDKVVISTEPRGKEQNTKENDFRRDNNTYEKRMVIREWDVGKGDNRESRDEGQGVGARYLRNQPDGDRNEKRKRRSKSPSPARKFKKKEDEAPSKLLDDLFRKTKATPCIYWLPLNAETILIKEEQRRKHMAEHERRMEELRRANEERSSRHTYHSSNRFR